MEQKHVGVVTQVIGPVIDVRFDDGRMPDILNAIEVNWNGRRLVAEVSAHMGDNVARCIAMSSTDGLVRGTEAVDTGRGITVPVGPETLGRMFNVLGDPVDEKPAPETKERWEIHRPAPTYEEQSVNTEILESPVRKHLNCRFIKVVAAFDTQTLDYYGEIRNVLFQDIPGRCIRYA